MTILDILLEPAILIISAVFFCFIFVTLSNYVKINKSLNSIYDYLKSLNKNEISFKYNQLDEFMSANPYTGTIWEDFKKALIFPDKLYLASQNQKNPNEIQTDVFLTIDASYFFNEESLVTSKINYKFIQKSYCTKNKKC